MNDDLDTPTTRHGERAFSAILTVMLLLPMLGFASLVVDVGYWYDRAAEVQKAADAAALAGVVHLPDEDEARSIALEAATRNGFENGVDGVTVTVDKFPGSDNRLQVTILDTNVEMFFADLFISDVDIERTALSEFARSIPMGNPENRLGTDPEQGIVNDYYVSISAGGEYKVGGDRHADKGCNASTALCTDGAFGNLVSNGGEYREEGYLFALRVKEDRNLPLVVEVFDPAHNAADQECDAAAGVLPLAYFSGSPPPADALLSGDLALLFPDDDKNNDGDFLDDWAERYGNYGGAVYCTGDTGGNNDNVQTTTYVMRSPDETPWNSLDNPIIATGTCSAVQYEGWSDRRAGLVIDGFRNTSEDYYSLLEAVGDPNPAIAAGALEFASQFRRWVRTCEIPASDVQVGDYILQIRSNAALGAPLVYDPTENGRGRNHFSLRGGWDTGGDFPDGTNVELFALGTMAIDSNVPGADARLDLARITPEYAGQTLEIQLWDVGDASTAGEYTLLPPIEVEATNPFSNCRFSNTKSSWPGDADPSDCAVNVNYTNMNGNLLTALVEIPDDYTCNFSDPTGCFIRVLIDYPDGAKVFDHTTWSAGVANDPLRLLE